MRQEGPGLEAIGRGVSRAAPGVQGHWSPRVGTSGRLRAPLASGPAPRTHAPGLTHTDVGVRARLWQGASTRRAGLPLPEVGGQRHAGPASAPSTSKVAPLIDSHRRRRSLGSRRPVLRRRVSVVAPAGGPVGARPSRLPCRPAGPQPSSSSSAVLLFLLLFTEQAEEKRLCKFPEFEQSRRVSSSRTSGPQRIERRGVWSPGLAPA